LSQKMLKMAKIAISFQFTQNLDKLDKFYQQHRNQREKIFRKHIIALWRDFSYNTVLLN